MHAALRLSLSTRDSHGHPRTDGQADKVATYLKAARKSAESAAEPGVLTYRTTREEKPGGDKFLVFEEYTSLEALKAHVAEEPFQTLAAAGVIADLTITYYEEMK